MEKNNKFNEGIKVSYLSIILNVFLSLFKFIAGIIGKSSAMISDAVHSASDVISTIVVIIGIYIAKKPIDKKHPYGHERFECVVAIILSFLLFLTGFGIGYSGISSILSGAYKTSEAPKIIALVAAIVSIIVKEIQYYITISVAKKLNSGALKADAWHHRSDSLSSIGALIGILGARLGFTILDPIVSLVICLFIFKVAYDIINDSISKLIDKSCDEDTINAITETINSFDGVERLDDIKSRLFGNKIFIDVEIAVDGDLSLKNAHAIAEGLHNKIELDFPNVKHCMVHVNPYEAENSNENSTSDFDNSSSNNAISDSSKTIF